MAARPTRLALSDMLGGLSLVLHLKLGGWSATLGGGLDTTLELEGFWLDDLSANEDAEEDINI